MYKKSEIISHMPIGDDAGPGDVEQGKRRIPPGSLLHYSGGGRGEGRGFSYLHKSHMTYLAGSHVLRSWPGIRLKYWEEYDGC